MYLGLYTHMCIHLLTDMEGNITFHESDESIHSHFKGKIKVMNEKGRQTDKKNNS